MSDSVDQRFWWVWLPEAVGYFLLGAATFALGGFAIFRWSIEQWAAGAHASVVGIAIAAVASLCTFAVAMRAKRLALALAAVVAWVGVVAYILAGYGFSIPQDWWP